MHSLDPGVDVDAFFARLPDAPQRVLMLDYDGTLAPFHPDPRLALPYPRACSILRELSISGVRIVIVSGRRMEDLRAILALLPHSEVWASDGWEHASGGRVTRRIPAADVRKELALAAACANQLRGEGIRIEEKIASVAVHWRGLPLDAVSRVRDALRKAWFALNPTELTIAPFEGGMEVRARAWGKGDAARAVLDECVPGAACAYVGDDSADEEAFRAIRGKGLAVLVREARRTTSASVWISQRWEVTAFLERWRCGNEAVA